MASDEDLKLSDMLRYYMRDSQAAKVNPGAGGQWGATGEGRQARPQAPAILRPCRPQDLLYRRLRALADYENANKALDKARTRNREVRTAESHQQLCCQRFERLSDSAKQGKPHGPRAPAAGQPTPPGSHFSSLPSRAHGLQVPPCVLLPQEPHRAGGAGA